jgi:mannan endo-1,4-beta-mannosidase
VSWFRIHLRSLRLTDAINLTRSSIWSIQGHDDTCCNFVKHEDGYSLYYPNGNLNKTTGALDAGSQANILAVVQHWYRVTGREVPKTLPGVACPQPEF